MRTPGNKPGVGDLVTNLGLLGGIGGGVALLWKATALPWWACILLGGQIGLAGFWLLCLLLAMTQRRDL